MHGARPTAILATLLLIASCSAQGAPHAAGSGRIVVDQVDGPSLEGNALGVASTRRISIYLPPSYDASPDRRYPTLYVLHGITDTDRVWTTAWATAPPGYATLQALMDRGVAEGRFGEMILVIPDSDKSCHYTNSPVKGNWEDFLRGDLVAHVDGAYRTLADAAHRGITGHSMGGHGAIKLGMKYPDVFGSVYGLNPSLLGWGGDLSADNAALAGLAAVDSLEDLPAAHFYVQALVGIGQCLSPDPGGSALMTQLPFAVRDGRVVDASPGRERWQAQMPLYMLDEFEDNLRRLRALRFDTALVEQFTHIPMSSRAFSDALTERDVPHTFEMYNGDHRNRLWGPNGRLFTELLPFFSDVLGAAGTTATD